MKLILLSVTFKEIVIITFKIMVFVSKRLCKYVNVMTNKVCSMLQQTVQNQAHTKCEAGEFPLSYLARF